MTDEKNYLEDMDRITEAFFRFKNKLIEEKYEELPVKMTTTKYRMLKTIKQTDQCMVADIVRNLELSSGATTLILNKLEEENLLTRKRYEKDRRIVFLRLTKQGEDILHKISESRKDFFTAALKTLTDDEKMQLMHLLQKITVDMDL
ncbi:MarR family winged helix-turn-helix transcriptional regulator [Peribacillus deserti]|uniref:MarR family transcriptional regulator n=1 Tax=Peribacillus deserti TaxID=673318 RepID=A0A2N5M3R3_9BACI|nr:MarR family transcriptional regulator [Peribacillus deserti]PLT29001.1 MarR family transcriptional regulator [Peribacillus deserti]